MIPLSQRHGKEKKMRRLLMVALLGAVMLALTALPAAAAASTCTDAASTCTVKGTAVEGTVCEVLAGESGMFEWRSGGVCWVNHPVTVSGL
jgi:type 1 fimbria pilin